MKRLTFILIATLLVMLNIDGNDLFTTITNDILTTLPNHDLPNQH
ncbi:hypothetical protein AA0X95_04480 [Bacillus sp. 1P10SD]